MGWQCKKLLRTRLGIPPNKFIIITVGYLVKRKGFKEIFESSPQAGPIVNFLLKNALAYGIYELRQSDMNWPFTTTPPLSFDTFRLGATFTF